MNERETMGQTQSNHECKDKKSLKPATSTRTRKIGLPGTILRMIQHKNSCKVWELLSVFGIADASSACLLLAAAGAEERVIEVVSDTCELMITYGTSCELEGEKVSE